MPAGVRRRTLAWQVGHSAMAEYGLCLYRVRGRVSEDTQLMPASTVALCGHHRSKPTAIPRRRKFAIPWPGCGAGRNRGAAVHGR